MSSAGEIEGEDGFKVIVITDSVLYRPLVGCCGHIVGSTQSTVISMLFM